MGPTLDSPHRQGTIMRLVYLSPVSWHSFAQRPHELVRQFHAATQAPVLWVEPYPTRLPVLADLLTRPPYQGPTVAVPCLLYTSPSPRD